MEPKSSSPYHSSETDLKTHTSLKDISRKKYNVINENTRKEIIRMLTEENCNIKDVMKEKAFYILK